SSSGSGIVSYYTPSYFRNRNEYKSAGITSSGKAVNYLDGINAATAYAKYYGKNANNEMVTDLKGKNYVGVIDTGVWISHDEFKKADNSSKVIGYNYDFGPCEHGVTHNCWRFDKTWTAYERIDGKWYFSSSQMILVDSYGNDTDQVLWNVTAEEYNEWKENYPDNYDWNKSQYDISPLPEVDFLHGSNIAGLIASNWNSHGNLGVAFSNTDIAAVRWDLKSSLYKPVYKLLHPDTNIYPNAEKVVAINMSFGTPATSSINASNISSMYMYLPIGYLDAMKAIINENKTKVSNNRTVTDGVIVVKSAGNNEISYSQPDIESGIKFLNFNGVDYSKLQMLVVVAADVNLDSNGVVKNYSLSSFSNKCGVTAPYCIAAPGGNQTSEKTTLMYGPGKVERYVGMAGTSQAAPMVTGSIAFIKSAYPDMAASEIIELLRETANTNGSEYSSKNHADTTYGAGLLDLGKAVTTYISPSTSSYIVTTAAGDSVGTSTIRLDNAVLFTTSSFAGAVHKALPETITAFDRYRRPFELSTNQYVRTTHASYKKFRNDVAHIGQTKNMVQNNEHDITFAYNTNAQQMNFMSADYKNGKNNTGFYFSENTLYHTNNRMKRELKNPFMALTSAYGVYHSHSLGNNKYFKFEAVGGRNGLYDGDEHFNDNKFKKRAYALDSEFTLHRSNKFAISLSSGLLYEEDALLGMNGEGAFTVSGGQTYNTGVAVSWFALPKVTLTAGYYRGYTPKQKFTSGLLKTSRLESESYAFDANYQWNKELNFGLRISSPLRVVKGQLSVNFPSGRDYETDMVYRERYSAGLKPERREYKFALYADKEVSERLCWSTEFDVRVNPEHQKTANDYRALFGLSWKFN
ncbi:MAG: S8 family serine peptidase, partial [Alphaproteobacteria bacterium]|nr:S8 family serine peptidase [Alphaproteobacteria bacterium]